MTEPPLPGWHADPFGRFDLRYWDGHRWTEHVEAAGRQGVDAPIAAPAAAAPAAAGPAPGWYVDPTGTGVRRYWDGNRWTEHVEAGTSPAAPPAPVPAPPSRASKKIAKQVRKAGAANIASLNSRVPMVFGAAYSAAKAGVVSLTQSAAIELGDLGIRVTAVSPGLTATPLVDPMLALPGAEDAFLRQIPLRRPATPEDIAGAALFLASADATYISGANLFVDGGWEHTAYPDLRTLLGG